MPIVMLPAGMLAEPEHVMLPIALIERASMRTM